MIITIRNELSPCLPDFETGHSYRLNAVFGQISQFLRVFNQRPSFVGLFGILKLQQLLTLP